MVCHPLFPNISVQIEHNGGPTAEEKVEPGDPNLPKSVLCTIKAVAGTKFDITLRVSGEWNYGCHSLVFVVWIGERSAGHVVCLSKEFLDGLWLRILVDGPTGSPVQHLPLEFPVPFEFPETVKIHVHRIVSWVDEGMKAPEGSVMPITILRLDQYGSKWPVLSSPIFFEGSLFLKALKYFKAVIESAPPEPMALFTFRCETTECETKVNPIKSLSTIDSNARPARGIDSGTPLTEHRLQILAVERIRDIETSALTVGNLEELAAAQSPSVDISCFTLKRLKVLAFLALSKRGDVPRPEYTRAQIEDLAEERLAEMSPKEYDGFMKFSARSFALQEGLSGILQNDFEHDKKYST